MASMHARLDVPHILDLQWIRYGTIMMVVGGILKRVVLYFEEGGVVL